MKIIIADYSGFCFGVENAIDTSLKETERKDSDIYSLGPLIHNNQVIDLLNDKGINIIGDIEEVKNKKVIIRSHGVPFEIYEKAKENNIEIVDCTCPFVRKIQEKVKEFYEKGYTIIIVGNPNHPEVIGIKGWCNNKAYVIETEEDVNKVKESSKMCIVAQTTITNEKFEKLSKLAAQKGKEVEIFNTICNATKLRQESCAKVAKQVDAMIVIGGYHSSNTQKLVQISKKYCSKTYHIETADELPMDEIKNLKTVGVTAGASTPEWLIKEVVNKMEKDTNKMNEMMEAIENSMVQLHKGDIIKGKVITVTEDEVMVNIGYKSDGIIKRDELSNDVTIKPKDIVKPGDEIEVYVLKMDDGEGNVVLSKKRVDNIKGWEQLEEIFNKQDIVRGKVIEAVKGGVICIIKDIRGFIPASQLSTRYVEDLNAYLNKELDVKIIEFNKKRNRVILSSKIVEKEEKERKKNELLNSLQEGQKLKGVVKRLTNFGVFVDIGGIDGLIHISDLSWGRVSHPSEIVKENDNVEVVVLEVDKEAERISLGLKQLIAHPWENVKEKYNIGDVVEGKVTRLVDFGAFVELEPGLEGLVHISQISNEHIAKPSDKLKEGEMVRVKILDIQEEERRISLSIKELEGKEEIEEYTSNEEVPDATIEEIIKNK